MRRFAGIGRNRLVACKLTAEEWEDLERYRETLPQWDRKLSRVIRNALELLFNMNAVRPLDAVEAEPIIEEVKPAVPLPNKRKVKTRKRPAKRKVAS